MFISNDNDSYYTEAFKSRLAVDAFVYLIQVARDKAFPIEGKTHELALFG